MRIAVVDDDPIELLLLRELSASFDDSLEFEGHTSIRAFIESGPERCDLVFLDPPYRQGLAGPALAALHQAGWIAAGTICVVETGSAEDPEVPGGFETLDTRKYGAARVHFLRCA